MKRYEPHPEIPGITIGIDEELDPIAAGLTDAWLHLIRARSPNPREGELRRAARDLAKPALDAVLALGGGLPPKETRRPTLDRYIDAIQALPPGIPDGDAGRALDRFDAALRAYVGAVFERTGGANDRQPRLTLIRGGT